MVIVLSQAEEAALGPVSDSPSLATRWCGDDQSKGILTNTSKTPAADGEDPGPAHSSAYGLPAPLLQQLRTPPDPPALLPGVLPRLGGRGPVRAVLLPGDQSGPQWRRRRLVGVHSLAERTRRRLVRQGTHPPGCGGGIGGLAVPPPPCAVAASAIRPYAPPPATARRGSSCSSPGVTASSITSLRSLLMALLRCA